MKKCLISTLKTTLILVCGFCFSLPSAHANFCNTSSQTLVEKYSKKLDLSIMKWERIFIDYVACKEMPNDPSKAILAFSLPNNSKEMDLGQTYDLVVTIIDTSNGDVLSKLVEKSTIHSDSLSYQSLEIDSTTYNLSHQKYGFGVKFFHIAGNNYSEEALNLYTQKGDKIVKLVSGLSVRTDRSEINQVCDAQYTSKVSSLTMGSVKTNGLYNITVKTQINLTIESPSSSQACSIEEKVSNTCNTQLVFNGINYKIPKALRAVMID